MECVNTSGARRHVATGGGKRPRPAVGFLPFANAGRGSPGTTKGRVMAEPITCANWRVKLAVAIHHLLERFGVEPLRSLVDQWWREYSSQRRARRDREAQRQEFFRRLLEEPPRDSCGRGMRLFCRAKWQRERGGHWRFVPWRHWHYLPGPDWIEEIPEALIFRPEGGIVEVPAFVPPELAALQEPALPLPISPDPDVEHHFPPQPRTYTLPEKATALAAIHDRHWHTGEPIVKRPAPGVSREFVEWFQKVAMEPRDEDEQYLWSFLADVRKDLEGEGSHKAHGDKGAAPAGPRRKKASTEKGEARAKIIGKLTEHHKYADGGCLNLEPIGSNELARDCHVSKAAVSEFFAVEFNHHAGYKLLCVKDAKTLAMRLSDLNGEQPTRELLYGSNPPQAASGKGRRAGRAPGANEGGQRDEE